jgi:membrane protease YdiL (CAAX protease family)
VTPFMSSIPARPTLPPTRSSGPGIAPPWHTAIVLFVLLGVSLLGAHIDLRGVFGMRGRLPSYLFVIVFEWATVAFIVWGLHRRDIRLSDVIGGRWTRGLYVLRDVGLGIAFILIFGGAVQVLTHVLNVAPPPRMLEMLPQTPIELIAWVFLSLTGGFCEEVIFRGYLQRQLSALTHSVMIGIVLQALVFGMAHGYQGWKLMSLIALYGACFGVLAHWRRSLRPGIIGHALQDTAGGFLARFAG